MSFGVYEAKTNDGGIATAVAVTLLNITAPSTAILEITKIRVGQRSTASSEMNEILVRRMTTASTGTSRTPSPLGAYAASGATVKDTITADGSAGATVLDEGANLVGGWEWVALSEMGRIVVPPSGIIEVRLAQAPAASRTMFCVAEYIEKG